MLFIYVAVAAESACLSLKNSTACPAFADYSILSSSASQVLGTKISSRKRFEEAMNNYAGWQFQTMRWSKSLNCSELASTTMELRYSKTYLCSYILSQSSRCNSFSKNSSLLCKNDCVSYIQDFKEKISAKCNSSSLIEGYVRGREAICESNQLGNRNETCILAANNERLNCGFRKLESACSFCADSSDACCKQLAGGCVSEARADSIEPNNLNISLIVGISVAIVCFVGVFIIIIFIRKSRSDAQDLDRSFGNSFYDNSFQREIGLPDNLAVKQRRFLKQTNDDACITRSKNECLVVANFVPQLGDEIPLQPGDRVLIVKRFDDGWA